MARRGLRNFKTGRITTSSSAAHLKNITNSVVQQPTGLNNIGRFNASQPFLRSVTGQLKSQKY